MLLDLYSHFVMLQPQTSLDCIGVLDHRAFKGRWMERLAILSENLLEISKNVGLGDSKHALIVVLFRVIEFQC